MGTTTSSPLGALSFASAAGWTPQRTGDYDRDCRQGRRYAAELLDTMTRTGNPALLGGVLRSIVEAGEFGGVETGFCSRMGCALAA